MSAGEPAEHSAQATSINAPAAAHAPILHLSAGPVSGVLFALLGGAVAWLILFACYPVFVVPPELVAFGPSATPEQAKALDAARILVNQRNSILALTLAGALLGGSLTLAEGVVRRSIKTIVLGGMFSVIAGALFGGIGGFLGELTGLLVQSPRDPSSLVAALAMQIVSLAVLGAGVGLGLGASAGDTRTAARCLIAGLLAGAFAGLCYPVIVSFAMPMARTELIVPLSSDNRLFWIALTAAFLGLIIPGIGGQRPPRKVEAARKNAV
jgi:hypothetical protein